MLTRLALAAVLLLLTVLPAAAQETPRIRITSAMPGVGATSEYVPAIPPDFELPPGSTYPGHQVLKLTNYYSQTFDLATYGGPEIWIMRVDELEPYDYLEAADTLSLYLAFRPNLAAVRELPYLPDKNAAQAWHAQERYLEFGSGNGIRYITYFAQDPSPFAENRMVYLYQGITWDRKYYVAAWLPIAAELPPPPPGLYELEGAAFQTTFNAHRAEVIGRVNVTQPSDFTPNLDQLDATMRSLTID
jgi:hypothetical protein